VVDLKLGEIIDEDILVEGQKVGEIKDAYFDPETWEITHLEIQLTKEAANEILGAKIAILNSLAVSALKEGNACCTEKGLELKVSKGQLHIYLRPAE
jgi:sporulation protein YlmC with PRC-barrel domain